MASNLAPLPPLPSPLQPVINPQTGLINQAWFQYFRAVDAHMRDAERRLTAGSL